MHEILSKQTLNKEWHFASRRLLPLTPALSPPERENRSSVLRQSPAPLCPESRNRCLPLPKGEGRGEGEGIGRRSGDLTFQKKSLARHSLQNRHSRPQQPNDRSELRRIIAWILRAC